MIKLMTALRKTALLAILLNVISLPVMALEETSERPEFAIGTMLGSLILVLACIFFFAFLMKKTNLFRHGSSKNPIKVIATHPLTNKSRVQIIEVNNKQYLLGVSDQAINLLDQLESPVDDIASEDITQKNPSFTAAFAAVLSKAGKKNNE
ncbi:flagellar biosynthetic protein FliO [Psychromonas algicola]|uniref:flagellar biosynthetic protein FliO n=1 Tax=Psychromonas algicola TaxID=2555642 RepID=UPI001FBC0729|nr:flagellar biosynthetic protein FliO [Psychromonas sp. RZ5]